MAQKKRILITDDERSIRNTLKDILEFEDYEVSEASNGMEALQLCKEQEFDLMLLDIKMEGMDGMQVLRHLNEGGSKMPVIMLSGHGTIEIALEATKLGVFDFMEKPPDLNRLLTSVKNALEQEKLIEEFKKEKEEQTNRAIEEDKVTSDPADLPNLFITETGRQKIQPIVGNSPAIMRIKEIIKVVAPTESRVLINGENGTGKELVAQWIHHLSRRSEGPFVAVNCAAIPSELLESELFGHEKGSFTGAIKQRIGKFELAHMGTLFLDEIGDLNFDAQAKLLRVLQESTITRVGGSSTININVRILAATNKNLLEEVEKGSFREDLYHRIGVIPLEVPSLKERRTDVPQLAEAFLEKFANKDIFFEGKSFSPDALKFMESLPWNGNVRELHNVVERLGILSRGQVITIEDVNNLVVNKPKGDSVENLVIEHEDFQAFKDATERMFIVYHLNKNGWNVSQTADNIGIQRSHLYNKMKKYNIER